MIAMTNRSLILNALLVLCSQSLVSADTTVEIAAGSGQQGPRQPQASVSRDSVIHVVYGSGDSVFYAASDSGGATFAAPVKAFDCPNLSLGMRRGPRIASSVASVVVTAIGGAAGKGKDGDVLAWRSSGGEWIGPVRVNDVADSAREGLHAMASGSDGTLWCCWLDLRIRGTQVYAAKSVDGGATWLPNVLVYHSPSGSVCECCHPSITVGPDGRVHVLFRNSVDGQRDMYLVSGNPDGTFRPALKLGETGWPLKACPMDGGMLAVDRSGRVSTAWRRQEDVYLTMNGQERHLGRGEQPWITGTEKGPIVVWVEKDDGKLFASGPGSSAAVVLADLGSDPVVVSLADGRQAFACWEAVIGKDRTIVGKVLK
jgi:hypothetical protein